MNALQCTISRISRMSRTPRTPRTLGPAFARATSAWTMTGLACAAHAASTAQPAVDPVKVARASQVAFLLMSLAILVLAVVCAGLVWALWRRRERSRELEERRTAHAAAQPPIADAWTEAGKRAEPATKQFLEAQAARPVIDPSVADRPVALVTGGARRVGRSIALELARAGCNVLFTYRNSYEDAVSLGKEIAAMGTQATMFQLDLSSEQSIKEVVQQVLEMLPRLDILVHNASEYEPSPLAELTLADIENQFRANAAAPLLLTAKLRHLLGKSVLPGGACVVAMTDVQTLGKPRLGYTGYAMSKAALNQMVHNLAREFAPGVRVNAVAPGVVAWPERGEDSGEEAQRRYLSRVPLGRAGDPLDAARAVRWLVFDATYMTGEILRLDGGRSLT